MNMNMEFYRCKHCGQIVAMIKGTGVPIICCGEPMEKLVPCSVDASIEKHVPVCEMKDGKVHVTVGSSEHPMTGDHYIEWIAIRTKCGYRIQFLKPGDKPTACFAASDKDDILEVFAYCNLHDLWKA